MLKKLFFTVAISSSLAFAYDFAGALDKVTDKLVNSVSDKATGAAEKQIDSTLTEKSTSSKSEKLKELAQLKKDGLITESEYSEQKKQVLSAN
jgi:hypothetical protein